MANADNFRLDCILKINNNVQVSGCPRGGMVDTRDLKSLGLIGRASSSLAVGTRYFYNFPLKYGYNRVFLQKRNSKYVKKELFCVKVLGLDQKASFRVCGPLSGPLGQFLWESVRSKLSSG